MRSGFIQHIQEAHHSNGFTLLELLVVVAVVGLLTTIVLVIVNDAQNRAKISPVFSSLRSAQASLLLCHSAGAEIMYGDGETEFCDGLSDTIPRENEERCSSKVSTPNQWPSLPSSWRYDTCNGTSSSGNFSYSATDGSCTINCTQRGCFATNCS